MCHKAASYDTAGPFPDLAGKGGRLVPNMVSITGSHSGITLSAQEILDLQAFLSAVK